MKLLLSVVVFVAAGAAGWWLVHPAAPADTPEVPPEVVGAAYVEHVESVWSQAWSAAYQLQAAAGQYVQTPDDWARQQLINAWYATEHALLEADWYSALFVPGQVRRRLLAAPVDEGTIDYVDESTYRSVGDNPFAAANFVRNEAILNGRGAFRMNPLLPEYLRQFADASDRPGHAPSGLYALEFLIWGQGGTRPHSDYARTEAACTTKPGAKRKLRECERRIQILVLMAQVLTEDVQGQLLAWTREPSFREELSQRAGLERMIGSWILELQRQLATGALAVTIPQELPHEFAGTPERYYQNLFAGLRGAYGGPEGAGLRAWAWSAAPQVASRLDDLLQQLAEISAGAAASDGDAWLVGERAQRAAAESVGDVIVALQELRERLQEGNPTGVVAGGQ